MANLWSQDTPYDGTQHSIIRSSKAYVPAYKALASAIIDSYSESNQNVDNVVHGGTGPVPAWGQSFTGNGLDLSACRFYLKKLGSPTGNAVAKLYAHSGTYGTSSIPTGSALATSNNFDVSVLSTSFQLITLFFDTPYTLANGTKYVVTFEYSGGNSSNCCKIGYDNSSPSHGGNACYYTTSWTAYAAGDTCFYCHTYLGGLYVYDLDDGSELNHFVPNTYILTAPIVDSGYAYVYDKENCVVRRIGESDGVVTHTLYGLSSIDFESMGWDTANSRIILPISTGLKAYNMADLSLQWTYTHTFTTLVNAASPLVVGDYVYFKSNSAGTLYKLNKSDGTYVSSATSLGYSNLTYASPAYDPDHEYIYVTGASAQVHCIRCSDMAVLWSKTLGSGMTTPFIQNTISYHDGKVFVPVRDNSSNYKAKIYALDYSDGDDILWTNTEPWDDGQSVTTILHTDDYVIIGGLNYSDLSQGYLYTIKKSDGTLQSKEWLAYGVTCGGIAAASDGKIIVNEFNGIVECFQLGTGSNSDSEHYMKNLYHNGYSGDRLVYGAGEASFVAWIN